MTQPSRNGAPSPIPGGTGHVVASPADGSAGPPVFYSVDFRKTTLTEIMWGAPAPLAILAWFLMKCLRLRVESSTDDLPVESLDGFEVPPAALPVAIRQRFAPLAQELATAGFRLASCHLVDSVLQSTRTYLITMGHATLPVAARLHLRVWALRTPPKEKLFTEFITAFPNGEFLWSLSSKADLLAPPSCQIVRREGVSPLELWKAHEKELASHALRRTALPVSNQQKVRDVCGRLHAAVRDFHLGRGVFAPLTRSEEERVSAAGKARHDADQSGSQYPEILAEMNRLQNRQTSWRSAILVLIVSMIIFLGVGVTDKQHSWLLLSFIPILLFHECGHYLAMRASGYRNLRMFFIPGFGAAVSGQHFNVPGWKKAVVSLMGPLPGILVGIPLGLYGAIWGKPLAVDAALLMLILNGLNLLPVLPLDGGHLLRTVLFSRNQVLDVVFRVVAAFALAVLAAVSGDRVLLFVAIGMFLGLPWAIALAGLTRQLRREGFEPVSADSTSIPPGVADHIIAKLRSVTKKPLANKLIAQRTLDVFETLNTRPPGWAASAGLLFVHIVSFTAALVFTLGFTFIKLQAGGEFFRAAASSPRHEVSVTAIRESPASQSDATEDTAYSTVVATFAKSSQASPAYDDVVSRLQSGESAALFGDTLLIRLPSSDEEARERWIADLQPRAADVFVDGGTMRAAFRFSCIAKDDKAAQALVDEIKDYFLLPLSEGLVAPWSPSKSITADQRLARKTYARLGFSGGYDDPSLAELRSKLNDARRRGKETEAKVLAEQHRQAFAEVQRRNLQRIADDDSGEVDQELAQQYLELHERLKPVEFYKTAPKEFASRLGLAAPPDDSTGAEGDATWAYSGFASRAGLLVQIEYVSFHDPTRGARAITSWLSDRGVISLHYDVSGTPRSLGSEDDEPPDGEE